MLFFVGFGFWFLFGGGGGQCGEGWVNSKELQGSFIKTALYPWGCQGSQQKIETIGRVRPEAALSKLKAKPKPLGSANGVPETCCKAVWFGLTIGVLHEREMSQVP